MTTSLSKSWNTPTSAAFFHFQCPPSKMKWSCSPKREAKEHTTGTIKIQSRESVSSCEGFWSSKTTHKLEEKHVPQQYSSNALALSQEASDDFVYGGNLVTFNNCRESAPGHSPALGPCLTKHMGQCYSVHFNAKTFLCKPAGYQSLLAGHLLQYLSTNSFPFDMRTTPWHRMSPDGSVFSGCSNLRRLPQSSFKGKELY